MKFTPAQMEQLFRILTKSSNKVYKKNEEGTLDKVDDMIKEDFNEYLTNLNKVFKRPTYK